MDNDTWPKLVLIGGLAARSAAYTDHTYQLEPVRWQGHARKGLPGSKGTGPMTSTIDHPSTQQLRATGQNRSHNDTSAYTKVDPASRIPANASAERAGQILRYGIGDTVVLGDTVAPNVTCGGT